MSNDEIKIHIKKRYQKIDGFGASGAWALDTIGETWPEKDKNKIADLLFSKDKGIGLSMWRFNIGAGSQDTDQNIIKDPLRRVACFKQTEHENYDWSKQAGQQWFLRAAKQRGVETLIAFVNSPPVWMTKNGHGQPDPSVGSTNLKPEYIEKFAIFLTDVLEYFSDIGLPFHYISPINEPTWSWDQATQEGNRYNINEIKSVLKALYNTLLKRDLAIEIDAPEAVEYLSILDDDLFQSFTKSSYNYTGGNANGSYPGKYRSYLSEILGDPEIADIISHKVSAHAYWSDHYAGEDRLEKLRQYVHKNLRRYGEETKLWMSEYCILNENGPKRDLTINTALEVARLIHFDLTVTEVTSWQWWLAVSPYDYKDGLIYIDDVTAGKEPVIQPSKLLWTLGHYSLFVRPGSIRVDVEATQNPHHVMTSAYYHPISRNLTIVLINFSTNSQYLSINIEDCSSRQNRQPDQMYVTSENVSLHIQSIEDQNILIPSRSIVTFIYSDIIPTIN